MPDEVSVVERINTPTRVVIFLLIAIALIALMAFAIINNDTRTPNALDPNSARQDVVTLSPHTLVYGSWSGNQSVITAYDLSTGREGIIAVLPVNIKKVSVTSPDTLIYISGITGAQDHGREISEYNLTARTTKTIYTTSEGFGIDDYVLSPDSKRIAVWEVQLDSDSGTLLNGRSRVFTAQVGNQTKNSIYDESVTDTNPVRYPRAVLNDGTVFMDRFLPNSGAGWAYGMSVSNFIGTQKEDLESMQNGTYGTQPIASKDGKYLAFAGYDGTQGDGAMLVDGYRRALVSPNTVELLNTQTRERIKLPNILNSNIYTYLNWNSPTDLLITVQAKSAQNSGIFNYNITNKLFTKSQINSNNPEDFLIQELSSTAWLVGVNDTTASMVGNLGDSYSAPYTSFAIYNPLTKTLSPLQSSIELKQLIAVLPATSFGSFNTIINANKGIATEEQLQLKTFSVKSDLGPTRSVQQSDPTTPKPTKVQEEEPNIPLADVCTREGNCPACWGLSTQQCNTHLGTNESGPGSRNKEFISCFNTQVRVNGQRGACVGSPLYLYGPENLRVAVTIHTPVSKTNPPHNGTFTAVLQRNGVMEVNGKQYDSIDFDYIAALKRFPQPTKGTIVSKENLDVAITSYAQKLGLNQTETKDLVQYAQSVTYGNYVFVSFFDHDTSHAILPITFNPKPDVYRNIVFYFKNFDQQPKFSVEPPHFEPIQRKGFTAVEISGIVE